MVQYTISISETLYDKARQLAQATAQPIETVIEAKLEQALSQPIFDLPTDEQEELHAMAYLSIDTLWTIAREQLPQSVRDRMAVLMTRNTQGTISADDYAELIELVERGNRLTLRKAQALKYLTQRGQSID